MLDIIKRSYPDLPVVIISGHGNIETAVTAIKRGAYDYIEKPFKADRLLLVTLRALEASKLKREVQRAARALGRQRRHDRQVRRPSTSCATRIDRVAPTNSRVLIRGPSGLRQGAGARA